MVNPVTKKDIDEAVQAVKNAEDENKKIQTRYKEATQGLSGALRDRNEAMIELYRPRLEKAEKEIADCIQDVERAIALVQGLQEDEAFLAKRFDLVEKLLGSVSKTRTLLTRELVDAKKLGQAAVDALSELDGDQEDAASEYARLEDLANDVEARLDRARPQATKGIETAKQAWGAADQPALTEARGKLLDLELGKLVMTVKVNKPKVQAFLKKYPSSELRTEAQWLHDRLEKLQAELERFEKEIHALVRLGNVASAAPSSDKGPDVAKAAKLLGVPTKEQPKLAKILAGKPTSLEKALAELASELELDEQNGKKLVAKLEKAKLLAG